MQQLLEHVRRHKVNIDGNVCTVMVTTLVLEVRCFMLLLLLLFLEPFQMLDIYVIIGLAEEIGPGI